MFAGRLSVPYRGSVDDVVIGVSFTDFAELPCGLDCQCNDEDVINYCDTSGTRTIGQGGPTFTRNSRGNLLRSTIAGTMRFDRVNFLCCSEDVDRRLIALHEIGHVLGIGIYDSSGFSGREGSFLETCKDDPANNNVLRDYSWPSGTPSPPTSVAYWDGIDSDYKTDYKNGEASMEDCATEGCGGSNCTHWEIRMFPDNTAYQGTNFQRSQDIMVYLTQAGWAQGVTGLSLGILKDVGYDDGVDVFVDLSLADPYPAPDSFMNRGGDADEMLIATKDIDFSQMLDDPPPIDVEIP